MIPVYVFYSMFGWQRTGDQMWAFGDQLGRGFLLGATAGRTTLTGEGLQHNDGHSLAAGLGQPGLRGLRRRLGVRAGLHRRDALRRMYGSTAEHPDGENIFYYLTIYNEPYVQPAEPAGYPGGSEALERASCAGCTGTRPRRTCRRPTATAASGRRRGSWPPAWPCRWALEAQRLLAEDWGVAAEVWSATSWTELRRDALACEEWNLLNPDARAPGAVRDPGRSTGTRGPVVAVSDWMRAVPDQIARWVPAPYTSLGTDGYGFSDTRPPPAGSSTWTPSRSRWPCSASWSARARSSRRCSARRSSKYRLDVAVSVWLAAGGR